uniref:Uncharacterized protein n=1 Tax=Glossina pallidipes TaxID=7398 RepID=A0A1A9ZXY8_GLOPL
MIKSAGADVDEQFIMTIIFTLIYKICTQNLEEKWAVIYQLHEEAEDTLLDNESPEYDMNENSQHEYSAICTQFAIAENASIKWSTLLITPFGKPKHQEAAQARESRHQHNVQPTPSTYIGYAAPTLPSSTSLQQNPPPYTSLEKSYPNLKLCTESSRLNHLEQYATLRRNEEWNFKIEWD